MSRHALTVSVRDAAAGTSHAPPRRRAVTESATVLDRPTGDTAETSNEPAAPMPAGRAVREATTVGMSPDAAPGRFLIQVIAAGWSLNDNYYPADVLKRDGPAAWPAGTQCFIDHATDAEDEARPCGSIRDLAAVLTTPATWDETRQALVAQVRLFASWREQLTDMADTIGMSIRAWVTGSAGDAEGRTGFVVDSIPEGRSVDFVTVPAAGGAILSVLEHARRPAAEARNVGHWFESRIHAGFTEAADRMFGEGCLTREERICLSSAVGDALAAFAARLETDAPHLYQRPPEAEPDMPAPHMTGEHRRRAAETPASNTTTALDDALNDAHPGGCVCVRDFDPDQHLVWFDMWDQGGDCDTWQQAYTQGPDGAVTLTGDPIEVIARTVYDPAPPDADDDTTTPAGTADQPGMAPDNQTQEEGAMPDTIDIGAVQAAREAAEAARDQALADAETARRELAVLRATEAARPVIVDALATTTLPAPARDRVTAQVLTPGVPLTAEGALDVAMLRTRIDAAVTAESAYLTALTEHTTTTAGTVRGLGATAPADFDTELVEAFKRLGLTEKAAHVAAEGR